ncbi:formate transporter FocA [Shewanella frigidimarina]|uniref:formate transporter FocA n=1 Tax=Shewanella frigidimarina TaxID=56812 RepID=UPI003D79523A
MTALTTKTSTVPIQNVYTQDAANSAVINMCQQAEQYGQSKVIKSHLESFGLAIFAGAFIALAFVFYITVTTGTIGPWGQVRFIGGLAFSLGLILVVICGGELFTSTVLSSVAWAQKRVNTKDLLMCWTRVYVGNFIGAMLMLLLILGAKMHLLNGGQWGLNALNIAQHKIHHDWSQAFILGILCNVLVCLGVWMTFSSKDVLTKAFLLMLPVAMFVSSGFEHSIANLFMVPLGIMLQQFASADFFNAIGVPASQFSDITITHFLFNNLIPVTLGNIVGGALFVGLAYLMIERLKHSNADHKAPMALATLALAECIPSIDAHISNQTMSNQAISNKPASNQSNSDKPIPNVPISSRTMVSQSTTDFSKSHSVLTQIHHESNLTPSLKTNGRTAMPKSIINLTVSELMEATPFTLSPELSIHEGLMQLTAAQERGAPVVDKQNRLLGFVSQQDLLRCLWSEEYNKHINSHVADLMQTQVMTVSGNDKIADLVELMVVDREKLFPVTASGMYTGSRFMSYEERLRHASANKPSSFPVVNEGLLLGVITREQIATKICSVMG